MHEECPQPVRMSAGELPENRRTGQAQSLCRSRRAQGPGCEGLTPLAATRYNATFRAGLKSFFMGLVQPSTHLIFR